MSARGTGPSITGKVVWSDAIEPMFGFGRGQFDGTYETFLKCLHPEDRQRVVDSVAACVEGGREYRVEHRVVWPDGTIRWLLETGNVIRDSRDTARTHGGRRAGCHRT